MAGDFKPSNIIVPVLVTYLAISVIFLSPSATSTSTMEVADQLKEMRLEMNQLNRKTGLLQHKNDDQDEEIRSLKNIISNLINKQNSDEEMTSSNRLLYDSVMVRNKRPASLIHLQHLMSDRDEEKPFTGPPSNCKDLNKIGHTLNGIYLVKGNSTLNSKINAVFCNFQSLLVEVAEQRSSSSFLKEIRLGYVDVKSSDSGIYFYVQIGNRSFSSPGVLRYDRQVFNSGGGMNLKTGVFTAPKAGIYTFSFSILKHGYSLDYITIHLRLNGAQIGLSAAGIGPAANPATVQSTLKLKKGDRIDIWKSKHGELHYLCPGYCHHFTGLLVEEDLPAIM